MCVCVCGENARIATVQKTLRVYQESLGLTLDIAENPQKLEVLLIGFKYVDARDPEKLFEFLEPMSRMRHTRLKIATPQNLQT